jgi:hypothetical protein
MLERAWQSIAQDLQDQNEIMARNAEKYRKKIQETKYWGKNLKCFQCTTNKLTSFLLLFREKLDDLDSYVQDHAAQLQDFIKECEQQVENSLKLFHLTRRMEFQMVKNKDNFRNKQ